MIAQSIAEIHESLRELYAEGIISDSRIPLEIEYDGASCRVILDLNPAGAEQPAEEERNADIAFVATSKKEEESK